MTATFIHDPGGLGFRIERLWAFLAQGEGCDDEGVVAFSTANGMMPMVCADQDRVDSLRPMAEKLSLLGKKPIMLARFDRRTDLGLVLP